MKTKPIGLAVRAVLLNLEGRLLLLRRSVHVRHFAGQWELPGGKVEGSEGLDETLVREVLEETGLKVQPGPLLGVCELEMPQIRAVQIFFEAQTDRSTDAGRNPDGLDRNLSAGQLEAETIRLSEEHDAFEWAAREEILRKPLSDQVRPFLETYL